MDTEDHPGVVIMPPLLFLISLAAGAILHLIWPLPLGLGIVGVAAGFLIGLGALVLGGRAAREFGKQGTNTSPREPALKLVTTGPFRHTRNPLYLSLTLLHIAVALVVGTAWLLITLLPALLVLRWGVIAREEAYLEAKFGEAYRAYKERTRRWI